MEPGYEAEEEDRFEEIPPEDNYFDEQAEAVYRSWDSGSRGSCASSGKKRLMKKKADRAPSDQRQATIVPQNPNPTAQADKIKLPFREKQHESLCRMHALNAFYGAPRLTEKKFYKLCDQFDKQYGNTQGISRDFFYVDKGGANLISWIVEKDKRFKTEYLPAGMIVDTAHHDCIVGIFEFSETHIWYWLHQNDTARWFRIDSQRTRTEVEQGSPIFHLKKGHFIVTLRTK